MKFLKYTIPFFLVLIIFLFEGCNGEEKKKVPEVNQTNHFGMFIFPTSGQGIVSGEDVKIEFAMSDLPPGFKKVVLKLDGEEIHSFDQYSSNCMHELNTANLTMGLHTLNAEIYFNQDSPEVSSVSFLVISDVNPKRYTYILRNKFRHDIEAYTQGLEFYEGKLYEGTGLNGRSELREVDLKTGNVIKSTKLDQSFFGEGITIIGDKIYQITYQSNKGFVYDRISLEKTGEFTFTTEGWGLTHDDKYLIMSDGTNRLFFLDKVTFERKKVIEVYDNIGPVNMINELEYINGEIWANVYLTENIIRIDPKTGKVVGIINCQGLFDPNTVSHKIDVLNGIAYETESQKIYLTGKLWPNVFEVEIIND